MASDLKPRVTRRYAVNYKFYAALGACAILLLLYVSTRGGPKAVPLPTVLSNDKLESASSVLTNGLSGTSKDKSKTLSETTAVDEKTHALVHELKKQADGELPSNTNENWLTGTHEEVGPKGRPKSAKYDPEDALNTLLESYEMILFSKSYCPHSRKAKTILDFYDIRPKPLVFELDIEEHGAELQSQLATLTGRKTVPNVLIHGQSLGGGDEIVELDKTDQLVGIPRILRPTDTDVHRSPR